MSSHQLSEGNAKIPDDEDYNDDETSPSTPTGAARAAATRYVYRDFSRVPPDEGETVLGAIANSVPTPSSVKHQKLPIKLDAMLSDPELSHIISWMPHGRSWRILKPKQFVKEVLPKYFDYCNYNSFVRLVNAWGFRRFSSGPDRHSYYHELFLRGLPHLHSRMRRVTGKDKKPPVDQEDEPDLYRISQIYPLPAAGSSPQPSSRQPFSVTSSSTATSNSEYASGNRAAASSSLSSVSAAVAPLQVQGNAAASLFNAASLSRTLGALSNPYAAALAAQLQQQKNQQQQQQQQQSYAQLLSAAQAPFQSFTVNPSYQSSSVQQLLQQYDLACLTSLLQGAVAQPMAASAPPAAMSNGPTSATGETPIMYIPVYPSTFAGLSGGAPQDGNGSFNINDTL